MKTFNYGTAKIRDPETKQFVDIPALGAKDYILPIMSQNTLGGGKAVAKTNETVPVAVDPETGQLYVPTYPETSDGSVSEKEWKLIKTIGVTESVDQIVIDKDDDLLSFLLNEFFVYGKNTKTSQNSQLLIKFNDIASGTKYITTPNSFFGTTGKSFFVKYENNGVGVSLNKSSTYDLFSVADQNVGVKLLEFNEKIAKITMFLQNTATFDSGEIYIYGR